MTKISQAKKNIQLFEDFASFITAHPKLEAKFPSKISYVVFSKDDPKLNQVNGKLLETLVSGGEKVVRAEKTGKAQDSWILTPCFS